jgi:hypothetical protein
MSFSTQVYDDVCMLIQRGRGLGIHGCLFARRSGGVVWIKLLEERTRIGLGCEILLFVCIIYSGLMN